MGMEKYLVDLWAWGMEAATTFMTGFVLGALGILLYGMYMWARSRKQVMLYSLHSEGVSSVYCCILCMLYDVGL